MRSPRSSRSQSYFNLGRGVADALEALARHKGPILTRLDVDRTWDDATATGGTSTMYQRGPSAAATRSPWSATRRIASSSGTAGARVWGDKGFAYASLAYASEAFTEAYGISV